MTPVGKVRLLAPGLVIAGTVAASVFGFQPEDPPWRAFLATASADRAKSEAALTEIASRWRDGYAGMIVDVARFLPSPSRARHTVEDLPDAVFDDSTGDARPAPAGGSAVGPRPLPRGAETRRRLTSLLARQTGQRHGDDLRAWRRWIWSQAYAPHPDYAAFKAELYAAVDPAFRRFFPANVKSRIRLDEIDWGGIRVNGIPPLRSPRNIQANEATWLRDHHVVFGVTIGGQARAYPQRILAWHEMALDRLGDVDLTIVYCTLCGTVVPYQSQANGRHFVFGTSGLLYRSNKLMFDEETGSLWSSLEGVPVVGPLVGSDIRLTVHPVVTTTWGEWKRDHPATTVLSLNTGYRRQYDEGAAYREYFADDRLMFEVPTRDTRLKNKAEVVVLRRELLDGRHPPVAVPVDHLKRHPVFAFDAGARGFVIVTTTSGANRLYERGAYTFEPRMVGGRIRDRSGPAWTATEEALVSDTGERLPRLAAHRAFWFGWIAQHPDTVLIR